MNPAADFGDFKLESLDLNTPPAPPNPMGWEHLGAELVYTQDRSGKYLSFYWQAAQNYGLSGGQGVGSFLEQTFTPVDGEAYDRRIGRVIERRIPEQCHCLFEYRGQSFPFELVISPILPKEGEVQSVLVMGHLVREVPSLPVNSSALPPHPDPYQKLLRKIGYKISRTLNLETIWQQTVDGLGETLSLSRCLLISYQPETEQLDVKAEYCQSPFQPMIGSQLDLQSQPYWQQALSSRQPVAIDQIFPGSFDERSVLIVSTFYQNQRNGLICLQQCDRYRHWSITEIELVQELADRVGTAIAHATLYQELERARKEAEEASRLKSDFLASTTHELRTPLNGIIGFLKLVLDGMADDPQEQQEFLDQAYHSAIYLLNLINDILDIAKIEAGKLDLNLTAISLNELFQDVEKFTRTHAETKNLNFQIKLAATYDQVIVYSDYQRLLQVMLNLVGNSIKFTNEGGIHISAEVVQKPVKRHDQEFPGIVKISVADTGIGVSLDRQDKIFEHFIQVDSSRTKAYGGTGLGLAISKKLVEAMGGKISFYSMGEGLGSTVTFTVPLNHVPVMKTVDEVKDSSIPKKASIPGMATSP